MPDIRSKLRPGEGPDPVPEGTDHVADPERFLAAIEWMRGSGSFDWADGSLAGIADAVQERQRVTEGQWRAVRNIGFGRYKNYARLADVDDILGILD